jgi:two-component system, OmpR family, osmolarity sensor histidine kinase EnvZ
MKDMDFLHKIYKLSPKSMIARFALIICIPMLSFQLVAVYIFYERHWHSVTTQNSKIISSQLKLIIDEYNSGDLTKVVQITNMFDFSFEIKDKRQKFTFAENRTEIVILKNILNQIFDNIHNIYQDDETGRIEITFRTKNENNLLKISIPSKPLINPTTDIFVYWMVGISFIFMAIALIFSKNQIRSIEELSRAADLFGRGKIDKFHFKPSGSKEIRNAGLAFLKMQERLERQVKKRLQMLAIISHDLRTPLTRMLLQLELSEKTQDNLLLKNDLDSMKHMIDSYLDFARGEGAEEFTIVEASEWLEEFFKHSRFKSTKLILPNNKLYISIKPLAFMRALSNLVSNAEKYSKYSELCCYDDNNNIIFEIDDNGKGISENEKDLVFKAFYRADKARNIDKFGSVGLGLPIAKEIILSHKGNIYIDNSKKLGGAKITLKIPKVNNFEE